MVLILFQLKLKELFLKFAFFIRVCVLTHVLSWNITILCPSLFLDFIFFCQ